jgi:hypothetical protein
MSGLGMKKILPWVPTGPESKNGSAGEGQQQITALLRTAVSGWQSVASEIGQEPLRTEAVKRISVVESRYQATST